MKNAQMLKFLFYVILALVIFIPTALYGAQFLSFNQKTSQSYDKLIEFTNMVSNKLPLLSIDLYFDRKSAIFGFSKDSKRFEYYSILPDKDRKLITVFERPKSCEDLKACICWCSDFELNLKALPYYGMCNGKIKCTLFENIDILSEKRLSSSINDEQTIYWKGGFLYRLDITPITTGISISHSPKTLYIERYKNIIDICLKSPCFTDEMKKKIGS